MCMCRGYRCASLKQKQPDAARQPECTQLCLASGTSDQPPSGWVPVQQQQALTVSTQQATTKANQLKGMQTFWQNALSALHQSSSEHSGLYGCPC